MKTIDTICRENNVTLDSNNNFFKTYPFEMAKIYSPIEDDLLKACTEIEKEYTFEEQKCTYENYPEFRGLFAAIITLSANK